MSIIAIRVADSSKQELQYLAKYKGITLSALVKMYITQEARREFNQKTENGITVSEEFKLQQNKIHNLSSDLKSLLKLRRKK